MGPFENGNAKFHNRIYPKKSQRKKWDLLKMEMRSFTIAYTKKKSQRKKRHRKMLQEQLNNLLAQSEHCKNNPALRIKIQTVQSRLKRITEPEK